MLHFTIPGPDPPPSPPPILISGLRIAGDARAISALGETEVSGLVLNPNQNQLSIDFVGLGFAAGEALRYRYKLAGADTDWSAPTDQRTINYASLSPGSYQFQVLAVTADGNTSSQPASISFTILTPIWQRWWFLTLFALTVAEAEGAREAFPQARRCLTTSLAKRPLHFKPEGIPAALTEQGDESGEKRKHHENQPPIRSGHGCNDRNTDRGIHLLAGRYRHVRRRKHYAASHGCAFD